MSNFFTSSIGKKTIMSITGLFLVLFLVVHLIMNILMLFDSSGELYNIAAHFMSTNPVIKVVEPLLAIGFIVHILYATTITLQNQKARPVKYHTVNQSNSSSWQSRNMYILGGTVFIFLVIHIINFFWKIKVSGNVGHVMIDGESMHDTYALVSDLFKFWWYDVIYLLGAILLGLHLSHGFWAAFQTLGMSNDLWRKRLNNIGLVYAIIIAAGFGIIPIYYLIISL